MASEEEEEDDDEEEAIRSTALKPTAPMARTTRRESNSATGFAVADEIILVMEVWPPARGMERASDLAADPESERDSSVLLVRDTAREAGDEPTTDVGWGNAKAVPHANVDVRRRVARQRDMVFICACLCQSEWDAEYYFAICRAGVTLQFDEKNTRLYDRISKGGASTRSSMYNDLQPAGKYSLLSAPR
mmetsp:Transcript_24652/g.57764  ORF Transcript_24652/g.57764 Transcript_24652/m.57764 type:complete len:190 (-) Transcript_24652:18-587(-)